MTMNGNVNNGLNANNALLARFAGVQETPNINIDFAVTQDNPDQPNIDLQIFNALQARRQNEQFLAQLPNGNITGLPAQDMAFNNLPNTAAGMQSAEEYAQALGFITDMAQQVGQIGYQTGQSSAFYSYLDAVNNYYGQTQQNKLNEYANRANVALDLEQLALRNNYGIMQKQMEMYVLDAQVREKLMGTFYEIEKVKLDNTFQRAKQLVQSAKY